MPFRFTPSRKKETTPRRRRLDSSHTQPPTDRSQVYQRGRTLAGATKPRLKASEARALTTATPREKVHHLSRLRKKIIATLSVLGILIVTITIIVVQFSAGVTVRLQEQPRSEHRENSYQKTIQNYYNQNPLERLRFNLKHEHLNQFVTAKHPEVKQLKYDGIDGFATSRFLVELRKPVVSWQIDNRHYYVDESGVSFAINVYDEPGVKIVDDSGVAYTAGTALASARFLSFVGRTVALAKNNNIVITQVIIPAGTSRQVEMRAEGYGYPFIMSIERSAGEQVEDMVRTTGYFKQQNKSPSYVDLRVKGRAFYRE